VAKQTPTFRIDLPAPAPEIPEDERHVEIDEVPVAPHEVTGPDTVTIELRHSQVLAAGRAYAQQAIAAAAEPQSDHPPLPVEPKPASRYSRRYREPRTDVRFELAAAPQPGKRPLPEGIWPEIVYGLTFTMVNLGDSRAVRARKELEARIAAPVDEGARFVPVISRQGGVGATTVTTLLGMALADGRDDRVLALDAHSDRGMLAERVAEGEDIVGDAHELARRARWVRDPEELAEWVTRDRTGLEVLPSRPGSIDDRGFGARDFEHVAGLVDERYGVVLTDGATGVTDPVVQAALDRADTLVVVSGGTAEQARIASEAVTWLEQHAHGDLAANAVVALNTATPGTRYESLDAIEAHFRARVRDVVRIPYDEELVAGAPVRYGALRPDTRDAARDLAALVVDGLPSGKAA
jgi:MinD-like ATPase involved in chromosome partitioning or flagellar assembly